MVVSMSLPASLFRPSQPHPEPCQGMLSMISQGETANTAPREVYRRILTVPDLSTMPVHGPCA